MRHGESGAAVVDFVLVSALVTLMFLALIQLALVLHVRNTVADAASSAARYGALADRTPADARDRAALLLSAALGGRFAGDISAVEGTVDGMRTMTVTIRAPLPVLGLFGPSGGLTMSGHALVP